MVITLVSAVETEHLIANWAGLTHSEIEQAFQQIIDDIDGKHRIKVDRAAAQEIINKAFKAIADYPKFAAKQLTDDSLGR